jgi:RNA polymerase sigma factor for flagellar operon FliA
VSSTATATATPAASADDEAALWSRWCGTRDAAARDALLGRHLAYAKTVAATYYARRLHDEIEFDEYLQHARVGMLEALERFDPGRGVLFRTFAARRMHGAILDGLERATEKQQQIAVRMRLRRERLESARASATALAATRPAEGEALFRHLADVGIGLAICHLLEGTGMAERIDGAEVAVDARHYRPLELAQLRARLVALVADLPAQQRTVIQSHYLQDQSFESLAATLQVTRGRVSQIHRAALLALRGLLEASPACDVAW